MDNNQPSGKHAVNGKTEGAIKFRLEHKNSPALPDEQTRALRGWFRVLRHLALLGQDARRYQGYAYGNISCRQGRGFLISCTQTSGREKLEAEDFSRVTDFDVTTNRLQSEGPCLPSSEALTHAAVYTARKDAGAVFHAHSPIIWHQAEELGMPSTSTIIEYGTVEMAQAIGALLTGNQPPRLIRMGGHEDGVLAWGEDEDAAGKTLIAALARAYRSLDGPAATATR